MPASDVIVRLSTGRSRTCLYRATLYRKIAEGTFPDRTATRRVSPISRRTFPTFIQASRRPIGAESSV